MASSSNKKYVNGATWPEEVVRSTSDFRPPGTGNLVAIDFGTTSCSVAYCLSGNSQVHYAILDRLTRRVPTSILIDAAGEVVEFGRHARMAYAAYSSEERTSLNYFNQIKMKLHHDSHVQWDCTIKAMNGKEFFLMEVIAIILRHLKHKVLEYEGRGMTGILNVTDFEWVITVPAIWRAKGKQMMREAAYKAGLTSESNTIDKLTKVERQMGRLIAVPPPLIGPHNTDKLSLVLEPEVAAIHCKKVSKEGSSGANPKCYMVLDVGGGTVDITSHRVTTEGGIDVILPPVGNDWGGTRVNAQFKEFLGKLVKDPTFHQFTQRHDPQEASMNSSSLDEIVNETFEDQKHEFGNRFHEGTGRRAVIRLPHAFVETYRDHLRAYESAELQAIDCQVRGEYLYITTSKMEEFFRPAVNGIIECLRMAMEMIADAHIDAVFLVGGFGGCKYLHHKIEMELQRSSSFDTASIFRTDDHELAVVLGALAFRQDPSIIHSRVVDASYGVRIACSFDPAIHNDLYRFRDDDGKLMCNHIFSPFVHKGDTVKASVLLQNVYSPITHNQSQMDFQVYTSEKCNITYTCQYNGTDMEDINKIGTLSIKMPIADGGKSRKVRLTMDFTQTEIQIQAYDITSGEKVTTVVDFLHDEAEHAFKKL